MKNLINPPYRLTAKQVLKIRHALDRGERPFSLAKDYGVHKSTISRIANQRTWKGLS